MTYNVVIYDIVGPTISQVHDVVGLTDIIVSDIVQGHVTYNVVLVVRHWHIGIIRCRRSNLRCGRSNLQCCRLARIQMICKICKQYAGFDDITL